MKKILLIEDFPIIQELYGNYLRKHDYEVTTASTAEEAFEKVADETYDYILLDLLLPGLNGIAFLEKFNNRPEHTRIIVLSDFNEPKTIQRAKELGVDAFWVKAEHAPSEIKNKLAEM